MVKKAYVFFLIFFSYGSLFCVPWSNLYELDETVDGIIAVVNNKIITLMDLKVVKIFGMFEDETNLEPESSFQSILEKLINQKLVIQLVRGNVEVDREEIIAFANKVMDKMGQDQFHLQLKHFGLDEKDLGTHFEEILLYQKIIAQRFEQSVFVNLIEIEVYYQQVYTPRQSAIGIEPDPMVEILDKIEAAIKQEKIKKQIEEWVSNLRNKADIQYFIQMYPDYFN
jgi:hypothetical protein